MIDGVPAPAGPADGAAAVEGNGQRPHPLAPLGPVSQEEGSERPVLDSGARAVGPDADAAPPFVDPAVSRRKFDREIQNFRAMEGEYLRRGWILVRAEYPEAVVLFAAPQLAPPAVVLGVRLDFTNYDFWPPSVRFVRPFTLEPLTIAEMPTRLVRREPGAGGSWIPQPLIQHQTDQIPFICARGVREYHHHPAHSNDPWLAYRATGVGTLYHTLNLIHRYGIAPMKNYAVNLQIAGVSFGFPQPDLASIPE